MISDFCCVVYRQERLSSAPECRVFIQISLQPPCIPFSRSDTRSKIQTLKTPVRCQPSAQGRWAGIEPASSNWSANWEEIFTGSSALSTKAGGGPRFTNLDLFTRRGVLTKSTTGSLQTTTLKSFAWRPTNTTLCRASTRGGALKLCLATASHRFEWLKITQ